jgi:hypothetical protein
LAELSASFLSDFLNLQAPISKSGRGF